MRARHYNNKAAKEKDNYMTSGSNVMSDFFYTTESNETRYDYRYGRGPKNYDDYYTSEYYERYDPKRTINFEGYTSATSYDESKPRHARSPGSKSEKIYSRRYSNSPTRYRRKNQSPIRDYEALEETRRDARPRNRVRYSLESTSEQTLGYRPRRDARPRNRVRYSLESTSEQTLGYRPQSSRKRDNSYMYDDISYEKYFEHAESRPRGTSLEHSEKKRRMRQRPEKEIEDKKQQKSLKQREYQIYAYEDAKTHNRVFMENTRVRGDSPLPSEIELKTHEYPVLAFKNTIDAKDSDMVYVPVLVLDKTNKTKNQTAPPIKRSLATQDNLQVYAANLENKNYFETMGNASYKKTLSGSHNRQSFIEQNLSQNKNPALHAESLVESILNQTVYSSRPTDSNFSPNSGPLTMQPLVSRELSKFSRETKASEKTPFGNNQQPIVYHVNVDVAPEVENDSNRMSQTGSTRDHLHDDYPVTKDYIKVNDGEERKHSSIKEKLGSFSKPIRQSTKSGTRNPSTFVDVITNDKISNSIADSKDATRHKSIVKGSFAIRNQSIPEEGSPKTSVNVGYPNTLEESFKRSMVEAKSGSLAIPSDIPREDGADIRNTQGATRLGSMIDGAEKQGSTRKSTREHLVRQSNAFPLSRNSTVSHPSPIVTMTKQSSISPDRASQTLEKKLSATQTRPSLAKPQYRTSTPIAETIPESRKSLAQQVASVPEAPTQILIPTAVISKGSRKSLVQIQQEVGASLVEQRKSKILTEPEIMITEHKEPSRSPRSTHQKGESDDALKEFTKSVFHLDYVKEPSLSSVSSGKNAGVASGRKSEVSPADHTPSGENAKHAESRKSQALAGRNKEPEITSGEKVTSVVNFSQDLDQQHRLEDGITPSSKSLKNAPTHEETTPHITPQTTPKSAPKTEETHSGKVAESFVRSLEPNKNDERKSTVKKSASQKSETKVQPKKLVSRVFKSKSQSSHESIRGTRSKSIVSKRSKQSVAKEKKTKKTPSKSIFGILKKSKSNLSNKPMAPTQEEPPSEGRQEKKAPKEKTPEEPKPCDCLTGYVKMGRACGHFFLGTTLHEQVMKMLQVIC